MSYSIIPVTSNPNQIFNISIPIDEKNLKLKFLISYNRIAEYWSMTIFDYRVNEIVLTGIPLLTGQNLLAQYAYLNLGSAYLVNLTGNLPDTPDDTNLGTAFLLVFEDSDE